MSTKSHITIQAFLGYRQVRHALLCLIVNPGDFSVRTKKGFALRFSSGFGQTIMPAVRSFAHVRQTVWKTQRQNLTQNLMPEKPEQHVNLGLIWQQAVDETGTVEQYTDKRTDK